MLFDKLCGIVESHLPTCAPILHKAKLFEFPYVPHEVLPKTVSNLEWTENNLFLPYPIIAIEDKASCIVLSDTTVNQIGVKGRRLFMECMPVLPNDSFREVKLDKITHEIIKNDVYLKEYSRKGYYVVTLGSVYDISFNEKGITGQGDLYRCMFASKNHIEMDDLQKDQSEHIKGPLINTFSAIQEIMIFNQPTNFILEERSLKKPKKSPKIRRSVNRPKYTILSPNEIRKKLRLDTIGTKIITPHERRRHIRWLSDEKYSKDDNGKLREKKIIPYGPRAGQTYYQFTHIPAVWVGPSEAKFNKKHYRVVLDR